MILNLLEENDPFSKVSSFSHTGDFKDHSE